MKTRYIVADTETTGLKPPVGVCEVGWIELNSAGEPIEEVESLIDPETPISHSASGVHDITNDDVSGSPTMEEFFSAEDPRCYGRKISADRVVLIAHNVRFDRQFLEPYIEGELLELCTFRLIRDLYPDMDDHKLSTAKYALGLRRDAGDAHRVMADVRVTLDLLHHLMGVTKCSLDDLAFRCSEPMLMHKTPFGKHRGERFSDLPHSYLNWAVRNMDDIEEDLRYTLNFHLKQRENKK